MSIDIVGTIDIVIKLGIEIKTRLDSLNQAAGELQLLTTNLSLLLQFFENPVSDTFIKNHGAELARILDIVQSIADSCTKCAKALNIDTDGATDAGQRTNGRGQKFIKRLWALARIPDLLAEIQRKATQLQQIYITVSALMIQDVRLQQERERTHGNEVVPSNSVAREGSSPELNLGTNFTSIDQIIGNLIQECKQLRQQLKEAILVPDTSFIQGLQAQNPEAVSFWRDRFQREELSASALRYEMIYVSWARFVHTIETSFVLREVPTGKFIRGDIRPIREQGSRYLIDQRGTRHLSSIRPLWLPALRHALDPLHKGYVKPSDYFSLLHDSSLSETLRQLVFESSGYGILVECERAIGDLSLPPELETPSSHVGWTSAQIVAIPTSSELGIIADQELVTSSSNVVFANFNQTNPEVYVHVRYLQTGQIERKSLLTKVRPAAAISIGAELSICHQLDSGGHAWSSDLQITQFQACPGGRYTVTAGVGSAAVMFSTMPLQSSFSNTLGDNSSSDSGIPELSCALLGPSKVFRRPPQVGEKIQIEFYGLWYDARVTLVDGDEIEYVDWRDSLNQSRDNIIEALEDENEEEEEYTGLFFSEEQLNEVGKGTRRSWRPWRKNIMRYDVRPYRRFHIGDSIEAPVMYPDFRYQYHEINNSQLYLPARIVDIKEDQYVVEFNPDCLGYEWWPGRKAKGEEIELVSGSGVKIKNPFDIDRVTLSMDLVRPFSAGPRPVLGVQSSKPHGWDAFQGVQLRNLEDLLERSLWGDDRVDSV